MAKRVQRPDAFDRNGEEWERYVADLLERAGYKVSRTPASMDSGIDMMVDTQGFGGIRLAVQVKAYRSAIPVEIVRQSVGVMHAILDISKSIIVGNAFTKEARDFAERNPRIQLITIEELERQLNTSPPRPSRPTARTIAGRAVLANQTQINITAAALVLLIDERLSALRTQRPNSNEAQAQRDEMIEHYEKLKQDVSALATLAAQFKNGEKKEREVVNASKTFADGVRNWWTRGHERILQSAYDMSLFGTAVAICSMAGAGGKVAVAVSAALVGGKQLGDALKGLKGLWKD